MKGIDVVTIFESMYPKDLAYEWDNVGQQVGSLQKDINTILLTLDVTEEVVNEAIEHKVDMIVAHHPLIFSPINSVNTDTYRGLQIEKLIKNDITLYIAHTNFDISNKGMNLILGNMLKLKNQKILDFTTENEGLGRIGEIDLCDIKDAIDMVKDTFQVKNARFIGNINSEVSKIAISGGSGSSNIYNAKRMGADLYVSGDLSYHHAHDALAIGLNCLDIGHNIEKFFVFELKSILKDAGITSNILVSEIDTNPYKFV